MSKSFRRYIVAKKRTAIARRARKYSVEQLERRINPSSVTFDATSGLLAVAGDAASNDTITIQDINNDGLIDITINSVLDPTHPATAITKGIDIAGLSGDDSIQIIGLSNDATINGGDGNDTIIAGSGNTFIDAGAGNDSIQGGNGNDIILGNDGLDTIHGGNGADTINGGDGNDTIIAGSGNTFIDAGAGNDSIQGGNDESVP